jgi:hypothetical protein
LTNETRTVTPVVDGATVTWDLEAFDPDEWVCTTGATVTWAEVTLERAE